MLGGILSSTYTVLKPKTAGEALAILQEHKEDISLILLDIVMPVMDGYAFPSHIGADPAYFSIPVIVTTQSGGESDEVAALSHGAADFVAKAVQAPDPPSPDRHVSPFEGNRRHHQPVSM